MDAFSLSNYVLLVAGVPITGLAEGDDSISAKRLTESASHKVGGTGNMVVSFSANRSGEVSIKLQHTSPSNAYLAGLVAIQELNGGKAFAPLPVRAQDTYRNDIASGSRGYIKKPADQTRGEHSTTQEWVVVVENLDLVYGKNVANLI